MATKKTLTLLFIACALSKAYAAEPEPKAVPVYETDFVDPEQQQLEWCFVYSNQLGYTIDYVVNPRLYETVGKWLGTPYHYSGENQDGIDCSGFVTRLYQDVYGISLEGGSRDIYKNVKSVDRDELREGDLVFFKIKQNKISHVGVYLGNNKFAHASVQHGVMISDLDEPYYTKRYFDSGRIAN
ncbi:MAG: C40 family peptidase [Bacteroidota bacterium]